MNTGDFFAFDAAAFAKVCGIGANAAAAYLIMARGTGGDNRTTAWSAEAIQTRTGMTWRAAKGEIDKLIEAGLVVLKSSSTKARPRYDLLPFLPRRTSLCGVERKVVSLVAEGHQPEATRRQQRAAEAAARMGYLLRRGSAWEIALEPKPTLIWLPNAIVDGVGLEVAPVERLRRRRDAGAFLLFADLYRHHELADEGGIGRRLLYMTSERKRLKRVGEWDIWKFVLDTRRFVASGPDGPFNRHCQMDAGGRWHWDDFFERLDIVEEAGLIEWTLYLAEGDEDDPDAGLIAPMGVLEGSARDNIQQDGPEWWLRWHAVRAALCLLDGPEADDVVEEQARKWDEHAPGLLVALERDYAEASLMGVARLRYRPRTVRTAAWWNDMIDHCAALTATYRRIIRQRRPGLLAFTPADIKV